MIMNYNKEKIIKIRILLTVIIFTLFISSSNVLAANLYFSNGSGEVRKGDTIIVDVKLSSNNEKINVADCSISFNKNILQVAGISTGDSIFNLWTRAPIFSNESGTIIFTGGTTTGFQGREGEILKIVFMVKESGSATISIANNSFLYLSDGKGTKIQPSKESLTITILDRSKGGSSSDEWQNILTEDKTPPTNIEIKLGRDSSVFDNKLFISFSAIDNGSGIMNYEVKEGDSNFIQTESPYVLKDQNMIGDVSVRVTDKSGNSKIVKLERPIYTNWKFWIITISALVLIFISFKMKLLRKLKK